MNNNYFYQQHMEDLNDGDNVILTLKTENSESSCSHTPRVNHNDQDRSAVGGPVGDYESLISDLITPG